ncbi:MAG: UDP-galactose-4-epimerase [Methanomethylovorans sp. PtaU1.Bin073]|nr:MAG: UDP-galactose-4-epimerase [Methanomethylovorans sp. PtaU1.Bin073]
MANCIVTGGAGFIGSHLASALINCGHNVTIIDDLSLGHLEENICAANIISSRLEDITEETFSNIDVVFHLASISGVAISLYSPSNCFARNIDAGNNVVKNCILAGVKRLVFTSSMAVYGDKLSPPFSETDICQPSEPYGLSKLTIEKLIQIYADNSGLEWSILRLHNVYGPGFNLTDPYRGVIGIMINMLLKGKGPVIYGDGTQLRAFSYVEDIIPCIIKAGFSKKCNKEIINLGSGKTFSIMELIHLIENVRKFKEKAIFYPERRGEPKIAYTTTLKSEQLLSFSEKTSLQEGLYKTIEWAQEQSIEEFNYNLMDIEINIESLPESWKNRIL